MKDSIINWAGNMWNGTNTNNTRVIQKKVDVNSGGFFSKKVFANNMWQQQNQNGYSPAPKGQQDFRNANKRGNSPSKRGIAAVNAYEYNQNKKLAGLNNIDIRQSQGTDYDFRKKDFKGKKSSIEFY